MTKRIMEVRNELCKSLNDSTKPWFPVLDFAEKRLSVDRLYIFIGAITLIGVWLVFGWAAGLICNVVGFLYPAYCSIKAIESREPEDDTKWLTYWVVFAVFSLIEYFADCILYFFPFYWLIKCIFFVWLMIPTDLNGSVIIYRTVIVPLFVKHRASIDDALNKVKKSASKILEKSE